MLFLAWRGILGRETNFNRLSVWNKECFIPGPVVQKVTNVSASLKTTCEFSESKI